MDPSSCPLPASSSLTTDSDSDASRGPALANVGKMLSSTKTFDLHVTCIPPNMELEGLRNIFAKFGNVIRVYIHPTDPCRPGSARWGSIKYNTFNEAERAILGVNRLPPFHLRVNWSLDLEERDAQLRDEQYQDEINREARARADKFDVTRGVGRGVRAAGRGRVLQNYAEMSARATSCTQTSPQMGVRGGRVMSSGPSLSGRVVQHQAKPVGPLGVPSDTSFSSQGEDAANRQATHVKNLDQQFEVGSSDKVREFGTPLILPPARREPCLFCNRLGVVRCGNCHSWYCDSNCQVNDWPRHKPECVKPPPLLHVDGTPYIAPRTQLRRPVSTSITQTDAGPGALEASVRPMNRSPASKKGSPKPKGDKTPTKEVTAKASNSAGSTSETSFVSAPSASDTDATGTEAAQPKRVLVPSYPPPKAVPIVRTPPKAPAKVTEITKPVDVPVKPRAAPEVVKPEVAKPAPVPVKQPIAPEVMAPEKKPAAEVKPAEPVEIPVPSAPVIEEPVEGKLPKCTQSSVSQLVVGSKVEFFFDVSENKDTPKRFFAASVEAIDNLCYRLVDLMEKDEIKSVEKVSAGDYVIVMEQELVFRALVLDTRPDKAKVFSLDSGLTTTVAMSDVYTMPKEAKYSHKAHALQFILREDPKAESSEELHKFILSDLKRSSGKFSAEVTHVDAKNESAAVAMLSTRAGKVAVYDVRSFHHGNGVLQEQLGMFDGVDSLQWVPLKEGDVGYLSSQGPTSSAFTLVRGGLETIDELDAVMKKASIKGLKNPSKGQIVASKCEGSDKIYRAEILSINPDRKKVRVHFIDYATVTIVPYSDIDCLPEAAKKFPIYGCIVELADVPSHKMTDAVKLLLRQLEPQLKAAVTIEKISGEGRPATVIARHSNGRTVNEMVAAKLKEDPSRAVSPVQGAMVGGGFNYDDCHVAEVAVTGPDGKPQELLLLNCESPGEMYVASMAQLESLTEVADLCLTYIKSVAQTGHTPLEGEVCLAMAPSDKNWYRGVSLGVADDANVTAHKAYTIFFADFGGIEEISSESLVAMSSHLMKAPFAANTACLEGFEGDQTYTPEMIAEFKKLLPSLEDVTALTLRKDEGKRLVLRIPALKEKLDAIFKTKEEEKTSEQELHEQIAKLQMQLKNRK